MRPHQDSTMGKKPSQWGLMQLEQTKLEKPIQRAYITLAYECSKNRKHQSHLVVFQQQLNTAQTLLLLLGQSLVSSECWQLAVSYTQRTGLSQLLALPPLCRAQLFLPVQTDLQLFILNKLTITQAETVNVQELVAQQYIIYIQYLT